MFLKLCSACVFFLDINKTLLYRSPMLCSHCFSGYFWRIRDRTTPWSHRIKLCRYAWGHENVYIPNKHQALLDWITYAVQERHKYGRINNLVSVKISYKLFSSECQRKIPWMYGAFSEISWTRKSCSNRNSTRICPWKSKLLRLAKL